MKTLISNTPHIRARKTTKSIMLDVVIALLPATVMAIVFFGLKALLILGLSVVSAILAEVIFRLCKGEEFKKIVKTFDFTSLVTGLLLGLNLGSQVEWYMPILGSVFAIVVVKMLFGGTGKNFVNPAIVGRIFLIISFPTIMTSGWLSPSIDAIGGSTISTGATALGDILGKDYTTIGNLDLFLGFGVAGSMGETCKAALLVGYIYLVIKGVINFLWPIIYIAVTGLMSVILAGSFSAFLPSILSGGLMLGAIFMATDYVTTPNTFVGNIIYFTALGLLTALLRTYAGSEVVSYCILLMNFTVPLIDRYIYRKPFGYVKENPTKKEDK